MKIGLAILITLGLFAASLVLSALVYFDLSWVLIGVTSLWAAVDSRHINLTRYRFELNRRPLVIFCACYLLWIFIFPLYLWMRFQIKDGTAPTIEQFPPRAGWFWRSLRRLDPIGDWLLIIIVALKLSLLCFLLEESWRGSRAWDHYRHELEAKGESFDWQAQIPPPVPDAQNFFKAPKMAEWFIKPSGNSVIITDDLVTRLGYTNTTSIVVAEITIQPPDAKPAVVTPDVDAVYRYVPGTTSLFAEPSMGQKYPSLAANNATTCPLIEMDDVPITTVIENLARQLGVRYVLDPAIGYGQPIAQSGLDQDKIKPEPVVSLRWQDIPFRPALLALLNEYGLKMTDAPATGFAHITEKDPDEPKAYLSPAVSGQFADMLKDSIGPNLAANDELTLLSQPASRIKPLHIILRSEKTPSDKELMEIFRGFFPNAAHSWASFRFQVQAAGDGRSFHLSLVSVDDARHYLTWSDHFQPDFQLIRQALGRPSARMDGDYGNPWGIPLPNYKTIRSLTYTLTRRAQSHLLLGQPDQALSDLTLLHDVCRIFRGAPTGKPMPLVTAMINVAVAGAYTDAIADGFRLHSWQEPQLATLQIQLSQIDLAPMVKESVHGEQLSAFGAMQNVMTNFVVRREPNASLLQKIHNLRPPNILKGFGAINIINVVRVEQLDYDSIDTAQNRVYPERANAAHHEVDSLGDHSFPFKFYYFLAALMLPDYTKAIETFAYNQTMVNQAQIACALERYHLAHGEYPTALDQLAPKFIGQLPHDLIGGQPLKYVRSGDGTFLLYSVGWNGTDEQGQSFPLTFAKGDWVWPSISAP